jgi:hypothetical protein
MNYYFWDTTNNNYVKCYHSCQTCTELGVANNTKCSNCNTGYYPLPDNQPQCYLPNLIVDDYFWDSVNTKYTKCYNNCSKCTSLGNTIDNQCQACVANYFPLPDNTSQCFPPNTTMNYYFWDAQNTIYTKCNQACKSCASLGTLNDTQCTTCDNDYYPLPDNHTQCYPANTSLDYYFWDTVGLKYVKCYDSCLTCNTLGDQIISKCTQCKPGYYILEDDPTQCLLPNLSMSNYYWHTVNLIYSKCYASCNSCNQPGDAQINNCLTCQANYYNLQDDATQCLAPNLNLPGYFWDTNNLIYTKCYSSCATCSNLGNQVTNKCDTCEAGYYPLPDDSTQCFPANTTMNYYFWDALNSSYIKCYNTCKTCSAVGDILNNNCSTCNNNYYPLVDNTSQCLILTTQLDTYYYDSINERFSKCYQSCLTCQAAGTILANNCDICAPGYYPLVDDTSMCYLPTQSVDYHYFDSTNNRFGLCQNSCRRCKSDGTTPETCNNCNDGYYPLQDDPSQCYLSSDIIDNHFFDSTNSRFSLCYNSCKNCDVFGNINDNMCNECKVGYYPLVDKQTQCYLSNAQLQHYYFDNTQFSLCYERCKTCNTGGDSITNNCTQCDSGYYSLVDNPSQCYPQTTQLDNHYFNGQLFDICYYSCFTCSVGGDNVNHNCNICKSGYYTLENNASMCYQSTSYVPGYAFDTDKFKQCYQSCKECSDIGNNTKHYCTDCKAGYYPLSDNNSLCYQNTDNIPHYYYDPLSETFKPCYSSCEYCNTEGDVNNNNCTQCKTNYLPLEDQPSMCYEQTAQVDNYFVDPPNLRFSLCNSLCKTCSELGYTDDTKCLTCKNSYYPLIDNTSMCHPISESISTYYFDQVSSIFNKCYTSCNTCSGSGTEISNNCTTCLTDYYYLEDDTSRCIYKDTALNGYFLDLANSRFSKCYDSCLTCNELGTNIDMKCTDCNANYYPLEDNGSQCYLSTGSIANYYFNTDKFYHCNPVCASCNGAGTPVNPQCLTCSNGYYQLVDNSSFCYINTASVEGYYYNLSSVNFLKCNTACKFCNGSGTTNATNCLECSPGYYPLVDNIKQCYPQNSVISTYYFDSNINEFRKCYDSCNLCSSSGDVANNNCTSCRPGDYPLEDNPTMCYTNGELLNGYFFDIQKSRFSLCYSSCNTCNILGNNVNNQCLSCKTGYYNLEDSATQCLKDNSSLQTYYFNTQGSLFKHCYSSCLYCSGAGDQTHHNCTQCLSGFYNLIADNTMCYAGNSNVAGYYFDNNIYQHCYGSCATCNSQGDINANNCLTCATGFFPLEDNTSQCMTNGSTIASYYFSTNVYKRCYASCAACNTAGDINSNNCSSCAIGFSPLENNTSQCISNGTVIPRYYYDNNIYRLCYSSCATCNTIGDINTNNCLSCAPGFSPLENNTSQCIANGLTVSRYYYNNNMYRLCYSSCATCNTQGNIITNNCSSCASGFSPLEDNLSQCIANGSFIPKYYFDITIYRLCYSSCATCNTYGTINSNNCLACTLGFYPLQDNGSMCYQASQTMNNYFWDVVNSRYSNCYSSCKTCNSLGVLTNNKCLSCNDNYYPLPDNHSQCYPPNTTMNYYFWDNTGNSYVKCYQSCKTCPEKGDIINNSCTSCNTGYYPLPDNTSQCYLPNITVDGYFWDSANSKYEKCYNTCSKCVSLGDSIDNKCQACVSNYFPLSDNTSQCFPPDTAMNYYFWDVQKSSFARCYQACQTCSSLGTFNDSQCNSCNTGYYPLADKSSQCYSSNDKVQGYYFDLVNNVFSSCYQSCSKCSGSGDEITNKCTQCKTGFYPLSDNASQCYLQTTTLDYYVFNMGRFDKCVDGCKTCLPGGTAWDNKCLTCDDDYTPAFANPSQCVSNNDPIFQNGFTCYQSCSQCYASGTVNSNKCLRCAVGYAPLYNISSMCYLTTSIVENYYYDGSIFSHCYQSCSQCTTAGTAIANNCKQCKSGNAPLYNDATMCFSVTTILGNYYYDGAVFSPCYNSCSQCTGAGTIITNNCTKCKIGYAPLYNNPSMCYLTTEILNGYYYDGSTFSPCYSSCNQCKTSGTAQENNCTQCKSGYSPLANNHLMCYPNTSSVDNYFFDVDKFSLCYKSCQNCSEAGTNIDNNCIICAIDYYPLIDNSSQCLYKTTTVNYYYADNVNKIFQKCNSLCQTCSGPGSIMSDNCLTCIDGFTLDPIIKGACTRITTSLEGYFYDETSQSFKQCYDTCTYCSAEGTSDINNCLKCKDDFYPLEKAPNCNQSSDLIIGYYFDSVNKIFKQCYETCKYCNGSGTETLNNCYQCADGMIQSTDNPNNCMPNMIFSSINFSDILSCYPSCSECSNIGNRDNMNCLKCAINYYPLIDKPSQCYLASDTVEGYYYDMNSLVFKNCNIACKTCSGPSKLTSTNCHICNYFYIADSNDSTNCILDTQGLESSYIDSKCFPTCATCDEKGDISNHMCTTCLDGFSMITTDGKTLCIKDVNTTDYRYSFTYWLILCILIIII